MKVLRISSPAIFLLALLLLSPVRVSAQWMDSWGTSWNNPISQSLGNMLYQNAMWGTPLPVSGGSSKSGSSRSGASRTAQDKLEFKRARGGRAADGVVKAFKIEGVDQRDLLKLLGEIAVAYDRSARELDAENNLAYAVTAFTLTMVHIHKGLEGDVDNLTERNVFESVSRTLVSSRLLAKMTDWDKQELHDRLVYTAGLVAIAHEEARQKGNAERVSLFRGIAGELLQSAYKSDPSRFSIEDNRLIYR